MLPIAVGIPTYTNLAGLSQLVPSLFKQGDVAVDLMIVCNHPDTWGFVDDWRNEWGAHVWAPTDNRGVAASWNILAKHAFATGHNQIILLNDDVVLKSDKVLSDLLWANRLWDGRALFTAGVNGWHTFSLSKKLYDAVGNFDEGFWPAYYEDNDYSRRIAVWRSMEQIICDFTGLPYRPVAGARLIEEVGIMLGGKYEKPVTPLKERFEELAINVPVEHNLRGSQTNHPDVKTWLEKTHDIVHARYIAKWGGPAKQERFTQPWDGKPGLDTSRYILEQMGLGKP